MPGQGEIGGGGSCWVNFLVQDQKGEKRLHAFDIDAKNGCKIKVSFPQTAHKPVTVDLVDGACVKFEWK